MSVTFLICVAFSGWSTPEQLTELRRLHNEARVQRALQGWMSDQRGIDRQELARVRRRVAFMQSHIELFEWQLKEFPDIFPPKLAHQMQEDVAKTRNDLPKWEKYEKVLEWAEEQRRLKPGRETEGIVLRHFFSKTN